MKKFLIDFALYFYTIYIVEDFSDIKPSMRFLFLPAWYIKSSIKWLLSPLVMPWFAYMQTDSYKNKLESYNTYKQLYSQMFNQFKF